MDAELSMVPWFRRVAIAEAISYICLLVAVVAKRGFDMPEGVSVMGPLHGILFLAYLALVLLVRGELGWTPRQTLIAIVAAVIPLGTLYAERRAGF